jgi:hypothetical protein
MEDENPVHIAEPARKGKFELMNVIIFSLGAACLSSQEPLR